MRLMLPSVFAQGVGAPDTAISRLDTQPIPAPVDACRFLSRGNSHDLGNSVVRYSFHCKGLSPSTPCRLLPALRAIALKPDGAISSPEEQLFSICPKSADSPKENADVFRKRRFSTSFLRKQESSRTLDPCLRRGDGGWGHKPPVSRRPFVRGALSAIALPPPTI